MDTNQQWKGRRAQQLKPCLRRGLLLLLGWVAIAPAGFAQQQTGQQNLLTPEFLIGDAVSLADQRYPEIESAIQRFRNRDGAAAVEFLKRAKKKYPKLPPVNLMMAKMQTLTGNVAAVRALLDRTVVENPTDPETYLILADQAYRGNRTTEADALFEKAEPLVANFQENAKRKRNFKIRLLAGQSAVAERRGQWDQAQQLLTKWVEIDPQNAIAHARLGLTLFRLEQHQASRAEFIQARKLNPKLPHPEISLAQLFSQTGAQEEARQAYEAAYQEEADNEQTAQAYAVWLISQEKLEQAQQVAAALRQQAPNSLAGLVLDGVVAHLQGDSARAEQALQKALSIQPRHAQAIDLLALMLIDSEAVKDQERALSYAEINAGQYPTNGQVNITRAWVLHRLGRAADSQQALRKGIEAAGQLPPDSYYLIARIMEDQGNTQQALQMIEKSLTLKTGLFVFRQDAEALADKLREQAGGS